MTTITHNRVRSVPPSTDDVVLVGIGQPLLDIRASVTHDFLKKEKLRPDDAVRISAERLVELQRATDADSTYIPGGSGLNTVRVVQWMWKRRQSTVGTPSLTVQTSGSPAAAVSPAAANGVFATIGTDGTISTSSSSPSSGHTYAARSAVIGSIGDDELGTRLQRYMEDPIQCGCYASFQRFPHTTGCCLAMVVDGGERSMVTMFGASEMHTADHLAEPVVARQLGSAKVIVLEAFYLLFNPELVLTVARQAVAAGKHVVINLSSTFVITTKTDLLKELFAYCDVIIGNKGEVEKMGQVFWPDLSDSNDVKDFGMRLLLDPVPKHHAHHRVVIITQGFQPTLVCTQGRCTEYPVWRRVPEEEIVDTIGAGDSFMGGFLASLVFGASMAECVDAGQYAASVVVRHAGCTFDEFPDFHYSPFPALSPGSSPSPAAPLSPSFFAKSFSPFASPATTPIFAPVMPHSSVTLAPLTLGTGNVVASIASVAGARLSMNDPAGLTGAEAAEVARLRKIARKHRHGAWSAAETARMAKYQAIAEKRQKIATKYPKAPGDDAKERALYDALVAETRLSTEDEDDWNELAARWGRSERTRVLEAKMTAKSNESKTTTAPVAAVAAAAPSTTSESKVHIVPTLSLDGASPAQIHEWYRRAARLMRAFDLRAAKLRSLTSEEVRKVLSTDGLAYLAEHETTSVSRPDFATRYARQGLPELST